MKPVPGSSFGRFEVRELIRKERTGDVYRARDPRLGREVALKVLPRSVADDPKKRARFEREARVLASLKHENIAGLYGFEEIEGAPCLVLELVEGPTLAERLEEGPLPLDEALPLFARVADALATAHENSIAHRDLNPGNMKIGLDGRVKILDFGLAKPLGGDEEASVPSSASQFMMASAPYLSPEQLTGNDVDARTDVWAFGCCLFEALTGRRAFEGENVAEALASILEREPPWAALPDDVPHGIAQLLRACLVKDANRRLASMAEARSELESRHPRREASKSGRGIGWLLRAAALIATVSLAAYLVRALVHEDDFGPIRLLAPHQVTLATGVEEFPSWSPDGRTLAFHSNNSGNWDIWVVQLGGGEPLNRTSDHPGEDRFPSFSPDGSRIAFWSSREGGGVYVMPALAGAPRKIASAEASGPPRWLDGGSRLAVIESGPEGPFAEIMSFDGGDPERLSLPGRPSARLDPSFRPDGELLAYVDAFTYQDEVSRLRVLRSSDGVSLPITTGETRVFNPSWSRDGRVLYFVSNEGGTMDVWRQRISDDGTARGERQPVTTGVDVRNFSFSPDWQKFAYSKGRRVSNVWRVPVFSDRAATWADAEEITFGSAYIEFVDLSPDGRDLLISSDRYGNPDLWRVPLAGGDLVQVTDEPTPDWSPKWSPGGERIAFYAYRGDNRDVWVMPSGGGPATNLTQDDADEFHPAWSPDGREIAFSSTRGGIWDIWVLTLEDGTLRRMPTHSADDRMPTWSPDGKWLAFDSRRSGDWRVWRIPSDGRGEPEPVTEGPGRAPRYSPRGDRIFFIGTGERAGSLWEVSLSDGRERPVTAFTGRRGEMGTLALATDGRHLYFTWGEDLGDLWVMDVVGGE